MAAEVIDVPAGDGRRVLRLEPEEIWRPLAFESSNMTRDFHWLVAFGRLKQGVSLEQAQSAMSAHGARIATEFPASRKGWGVVVERYADTLIGADMRRALLVLMAATGLVLLIGCVAPSVRPVCEQ